MPPKCVIDALPLPCLRLKNAMTETGVEVRMAVLRNCEAALVKHAFHAYHRQQNNWWPNTLLIRYNALLHHGTNDNARRLCLVQHDMTTQDLE